MSEDKTAPREGCDCNVCAWARHRAAADRAKWADLELNYQRYEAGLLVARDDRE